MVASAGHLSRQMLEQCSPLRWQAKRAALDAIAEQSVLKEGVHRITDGNGANAGDALN